MRYFLNFWWYITLQFVFALFYALWGLILCCTVILVPVGLGMLQFAKFLLAPHTQSMVSKEDLALITGKSQGTAMKTLSMVVRILYFPFGLVAAIVAFFETAAMFISIIGIPNGLVWARSLSFIFNPVNKVCVPESVKEEIDRRKMGSEINSYKRCVSDENTKKNEPASKDLGNVRNLSVSNRYGVREYSDEKLSEVLANTDMYNSTLVDQCKHEIDIRAKSSLLKEKVSKFDDLKISEILSEPDIYAEEMLYCCELEQAYRERVRKEELEKQQEEERRQAEIEAAKRRAKTEAIVKKYVPWVVPVFIVLIILCIYITSDAYQYRKALKCLSRGDYILAEKKFHRFDSYSKYYELAQGGLFECYLAQCDTAAAVMSLKKSVAENTWKKPYYYEVYAGYLLSGELTPYIEKNENSAIDLYSNSPSPQYREKAKDLKVLVEQRRKELQVEEEKRRKELQAEEEQRRKELKVKEEMDRKRKQEEYENKIKTDPQYRFSIGAYIPGDTYNGMKNSYVISVDESYKHGLYALREDNYSSSRYQSAENFAISKNGRLPSKSEMINMLEWGCPQNYNYFINTAEEAFYSESKNFDKLKDGYLHYFYVVYAF